MRKKLTLVFPAEMGFFILTSRCTGSLWRTASRIWERNRYKGETVKVFLVKDGINDKDGRFSSTHSVMHPNSTKITKYVRGQCAVRGLRGYCNLLEIGQWQSAFESCGFYSLRMYARVGEKEEHRDEFFSSYE